MSMLAEATAQRDRQRALAAYSVDKLIGDLADINSKQRIMNAWRRGRIATETAAMLMRECGLEKI
jgi:hypothetical protein